MTVFDKTQTTYKTISEEEDGYLKRVVIQKEVVTHVDYSQKEAGRPLQTMEGLFLLHMAQNDYSSDLHLGRKGEWECTKLLERMEEFKKACSVASKNGQAPPNVEQYAPCSDCRGCIHIRGRDTIDICVPSIYRIDELTVLAILSREVE